MDIVLMLGNNMNGLEENEDAVYLSVSVYLEKKKKKKLH